MASAVAVGYHAGSNSQNTNAVAVGNQSGSNAQGSNAVSIGSQSGALAQNTNSIAIGNQAGYTFQGSNAIAVGPLAGSNSQNNFAVAVGYAAGQNGQKVNSIILNASGSSLDSTESSLYAKPIRSTTATLGTHTALWYNSSTSELIHSSTDTGLVGTLQQVTDTGNVTK